MIDPSIITRGAEMAQLQQRQNMESLGELGGNLGQLVFGRRVNQMRQLKTPEEQQAFANNSIFAPYLNQTLTADRAAAAKAAADQLKFNADLAKTYSEIGKTGAETGKIGAETGKLTTDTGITRQNNTGNIWNAYLTGGVNAAKAMLDSMKANGTIDESAYQAELTQLTDVEALPDAAQKQNYALGRFRGTIDPKYSLTTADNVLDNNTSIENNKRDNETSQANNVRTTQASIYGTDKDYELGRQRLVIDSDLKRQELVIKQNEGEVVAGADGMGYIFYPNRPAGQRYEPLLGQDGKHAKAPAKSSGGQGSGMSATAQKELIETDDAITAGQSGISNLKQALQLSKNSYDGVGATQRATIAGNVPGGLFVDEEVAKNTVLLNNIVTGNALEMLKSTFGGAPTEGERQILLQLQGSANLPRAQREAIYQKAIQAAERRLATNQQKAASLRNGTFFGGAGASTAPTQNLSFLP